MVVQSKPSLRWNHSAIQPTGMVQMPIRKNGPEVRDVMMSEPDVGAGVKGRIEAMLR